MSLESGTKLGPYEIVEPIGSGGMGEVYRARDSRLGRDVAIKVAADRFTERFEREARAVAALNHPNICTLHDVGPNYLVMEYIEGESPKGPLPLDESLRIASQIADALEAAHEKGIVHRDLKPGNIKIRPDGAVKVLDFGLARVIGAAAASAEDSPTLQAAATQAGVIMGTAAYMSPEQARGKPVDKRTDIWAYGVVLYELLTGKRLFEGETISDTLAAVLMKEPDFSEAPPKVYRLLRACLERDPKRRLRDIGEAWRLLEDVRSETPQQTKRRAPLLPWIAAAALGIAFAVAMWSPWRLEPAPPVMRLDVDLGPDVALPGISPGGSTVLLSPDGTRLVYSIRSAAGRGGRGARGRSGIGPPTGSLFVGRLDGVDKSNTTELPGTEGVLGAFFSPDGQWIGFGALGKIKKISVEGGPVVDVADTDTRGFSGAAWAEDGTILFTGSGVGLRQVPSTGGPPVQITEIANGEGAHTQPHILPGGKAALFVVQSALPGRRRSGEAFAIQAVTLSDGKRKVIIPGGGSPHYLPTGHLVYVSQGTLFAVPFDPDRLETRGNAVAILDDIQFNSLNGAASISFARNGTMVYRKGDDTGSGLLSTPPALIEWIDEAGKRSPLTSQVRSYSRPRFSPDGTKLALLISDKDGRNEWVYDLGRDLLSPITFGGLSITTSAWTEGGRHVIFGSSRTGIHWARADGAGEPQLLLKLEQLPFMWSYSPVLKRLAYFVANQNSQIFTLPVAEDNGQLKAGMPEPFFRSQFSEQEPAFSPDGRWIAYSTDKKSGSREVKVRAFPPPASGEAAEWPISTNGGQSPRWLPNGRELLYQSGDQILVVPYTVKGEDFVAEKPRMRADKITNTGLIPWDVAPDGRIAVVTPVASAASVPEPPEHTVVVLLNFFDELRRRVPVGK